MSEASLRDNKLSVEGMVSAHSHAFQRALRHHVQRKTGSFWSWRGLMYELVEKLTPDEVYALSRYAFVELALAGVTTIGEFHYLHHGPNGQPYDDRLELSHAVIRAALDAGLRITLLRVLYHRSGKDGELTAAQRRFADDGIDAALGDVEALSKAYADKDDRVRIGLAPHSIRAAPLEWVEQAHHFAKERSLPFHMHVSEQTREIEESLAEYGQRPVALLADRGIIDANFVGAHATHLDAEEVKRFGEARAFACICRTTERDLGDGSPPLTELLKAGARLCFGVDSHAISDPFEEARAAELDERVRTQKRVVAAQADDLLKASTREGRAALGWQSGAEDDRVLLNANHPALAGVTPKTATDAVIFGGVAGAVTEVDVAGTRIVEGGEHAGYTEARQAFERCVRKFVGG